MPSSDSRFYLSPSRLARFFFHDCERHLRFHATPRRQRAAAGVPAIAHDESPVARAILEGGYVWEETVVRKYLRGCARVARGRGPLRDRTHSVEATTRLLAKLAPGQAIYQPTLLAPGLFFSRYGLDPELMDFTACRPDLIMAEEGDDGVLLRIVDVKASDTLKVSHRIQTVLYALILRDMLMEAGVDLEVDLAEAGIWLFQQAEPEWFEAATALSVVDDFLTNRLAGILRAPAEEVPWHLHFRCEWCEYFDSCREEAHRTDSVSLVPYLTTGGRSYLREAPWKKGKPVDTLDDLASLLRRKNARSALDGCGSLRGRRQRLKNAVKALKKGRVVPHGGSTVAMPKAEQVRIVLTLQSDPLSGRVYAAGFRRLMGKDVYGTGFRQRIFVAEAADECPRVASAFLEALYDELYELHAYNAEREWRDQKGLQCYVFDSYERRLLEELLFAGLRSPDLALLAMQILFYFQSETLAETDTHPGAQVSFPAVVLTSVIRELVALPSPLVIRLQEALAALPSPGFSYTYTDSDLFCFQLSNALKSDAIFLAWNKGRDEAVAWIEKELGRRMTAAGALVDGLRHVLGERLFAWPPKFHLPEPQDFKHPELSRLAFVVRYESLMAALATRESRCRPRAERQRDGVSIPLRNVGKDRWKVLSTLDISQVGTGDFPDHILVPEGEAGERAQMVYDDHRRRTQMWASPGPVRLAAIADKSGQDTVKHVWLSVKAHKSEPAFKKGDEAVLHPRFTDFTSGHVIKRLAYLDAHPRSDFIALIRDPVKFAGPARKEPKVRKQALVTARQHALTTSQLRALERFLDRRLTLVWGPPGTGKTYFLAWALACLAHARHKRGEHLRVTVTAFTHAAVENLLLKIEDALHALGLTEDVPVVKLDGVRTQAGRALHGVPANAASGHLPVDESYVAGGTVYGIRKAMGGGCPPCDVLVIDEGSQMKLGETALATLALASRGRLVIAGDDLQLPPIINGCYPEPEDGLPGLHGSVFEYLRARDDEAAPYTCQLLENWRMNDTLCRFPADTLYGPEYLPATGDVGYQRLKLCESSPKDDQTPELEDLQDWLLSPDWPLVVCVLEDVRAAIENRVEAELVARLSVALRHRLLWSRDDGGMLFNDEDFWRSGLFIVSPHHLQIRAIRRSMGRLRDWDSPPFVDTVDKMQGQQSQVVIASYGISDAETALSEAEFIYDLNRLNVSITRAQAKCLVFLPRPLLEPTLDVLSNDRAVRGLGHMHALLEFCKFNGAKRCFDLDPLPELHGRLTAVRCRVTDSGRRCPSCGSGRVLPIAYGELPADPELGKKWVAGGCCEGPEQWRCLDCEAGWS